MNTCMLCGTNPADKKNSHIVPKMFARSMLRQVGGKYKGYNASFSHGQSAIKANIIQDIDKKDYIFCSKCESQLSIYETAFANQVYQKLKSVSPADLQRNHGADMVELTPTDMNAVQLMIQSVAWRADLFPEEFPTSRLPPAVQQAFKDSLNQNQANQDYHIWAMYGMDTTPTDNFIQILQNEHISTLVLNDFVLFMQPKTAPKPILSPELSLNQTTCPIMCIDNGEWKAYQASLYKQSIDWVMSV